MSGEETRRRFLDFFAERGHVVVPSASLIPENDPSVLFNTAGMQPLVPYLMGQPHPSGSKRIVDSQKCVRTNDIDEVGDNTHLTFFEMLGNWSLGDYFKKEALKWSYEFLTSKEEGLGLDPKRLYVTVFEGDENAPRDDEARAIWEEIFTKAGLDPERRIFFMDAESNWWSPGDNGPCGPDSEMFYDVTGTLTEGLTREEFIDADDRQDVVEIWNDVFMEYEKKDGKVIGKLASQNVDTGSGLERVVGVVQGKDNVFETDLFASVLERIDAATTKPDERARRVIADHIRAATFLVADGVVPSNTDQGYILRRLLRRAVRYADALGIPEGELKNFTSSIVDTYKGHYINLEEKRKHIYETVAREEERFRSTLAAGFKAIERELMGIREERGKIVDGKRTLDKVTASPALVFKAVTTHGIPIELVKEILAENGLEVDEKAHAKLMQEHQELSRAGAEQKFKGGLADHSEKVVQYHTATHLLLAGLRSELGEDVHQAGSNITAERLRFDFTHPEKVEKETLEKVEQYVNDAIQADAKVTVETVDKEDAENDSSVEGSFWERYPDEVNVYTITDDNGVVYSRELCGGPHVESTNEISGTFKITKEESVAAGVRRVKAILE